MWPLVLKKTPYWKQPRFRGCYHNNPYREGRTPRPGLFDSLAKLKGRLYYLLVCLMAPHPAVAVIITLLLLLVGIAAGNGPA